MSTKTEIVFRDGKWIGLAGGEKVVSSYDQTRVVKMMAKAGYKNVPIRGQNVEETQEEDTSAAWPINQRFEFVSQLVSMVAHNHAVSLIVCGPSGLGKTHTVRTTLESCGLKDASGFEAETAANSFRFVKGYSTAKGLYRELYANRDGVLVFDDCDDVFKDPTALNCLKGALDSYDKRIINWNADIRDDDLPRSFQFNGRVIFVTNMPRARLSDALKTRAYCVDLSMTLEQKLERMESMAAADDFMPKYSAAVKRDAMALIREYSNETREVSLRTLQSVVRIRALGKNWQELARYCLTN